jgi:class 3 adenylate cyclase
MPLYIDIHELGTVSAEAVAKAHAADLEKQAEHGVNYLKYWVNESCGKVFCLVDAPNPEAAGRVHKEAHGLEPGRIIEVQPEVAEAMTGGGAVNANGAVLLPGSDTLDPGIRTIVFTDIVGSTELMRRIGDKAAMGFLQLHDTIVRSALHAFGGREVKHTGDGIMAAFVSAPSAVKCALRVQRDIAMHAAGDQPMRLRVGAASGEPVEHHGDFFGSSVNLAARLCAHAQPQQVLVSSDVVDLCADDGLRFADLGEVSLKGFEQPVRAHAAVA